MLLTHSSWGLKLSYTISQILELPIFLKTCIGLSKEFFYIPKVYLFKHLNNWGKTQKIGGKKYTPGLCDKKKNASFESIIKNLYVEWLWVAKGEYDNHVHCNQLRTIQKLQSGSMSSGPKKTRLPIWIPLTTTVFVLIFSFHKKDLSRFLKVYSGRVCTGLFYS